ncbi:hypothetical protein ACFE04_021347 [Oxalis oulophora]
MEKLDRVVASEDWRLLFPDTTVTNMGRLSEWSKAEFGSLASQIARNQKQLKSLLESDDPCGQANEIRAGFVDGTIMINHIAMDILEKVVDLIVEPQRKLNDGLIRKLFPGD